MGRNFDDYSCFHPKKKQLRKLMQHSVKVLAYLVLGNNSGDWNTSNGEIENIVGSGVGYGGHQPGRMFDRRCREGEARSNNHVNFFRKKPK